MQEEGQINDERESVTPSDLTDDTADGKPESHAGFIALDKHQKDVNVQHKKFRDEERGRKAEHEGRVKAENELKALKAHQASESIPPVPDQYSATYVEDMTERDEAIRRKADQDAQIKTADNEKIRERDARAATQMEQITERVQVFDANAATLGLDAAVMKKAADTVIEYGINAVVEEFVLLDPDGPLLLQYLSDNPVELEQLNGLSSYHMASRINNDIRAKASLLKPQTSNAPPPPVEISGGGVPESKESWEKGAKYE